MELLKNRAILHVIGPDAGKFLQSMTSNNILKKIYSYNYLLTNQARYLFDFFVYQQNDNSYFIDIHKDSSLALQKRLIMYKLRSKLEVIDVSDEHNIIYSKSQIESGVEFSFQDPRSKLMGYRSMVGGDKATSHSGLDPESQEAWNVSEILNLVQDDGSGVQDGKNVSLYMADKYENAIIDGNSDLIYDRSIPIEYGAEELNAIDYQKGCYLGQEVISRAKYQGVVRKKIFKLESDIEIISAKQPDIITDLEGNKIGTLCSAYGKLAIGLIREEKFVGLENKQAMIGTQIIDIEIPLWR